mgnify:CR=1 FL=1
MATLFVPQKKDIKALKVGSEVLDALGPWSTVTEVVWKNADNSLAVVRTALGTTQTYIADELVQTVPVLVKYDAAKFGILAGELVQPDNENPTEG